MTNPKFTKGDLLYLSKDSAGLLWDEKYKVPTRIKDSFINSIMFTGVLSKEKGYALCLVTLRDEDILRGFLNVAELIK